MQLRDRLPTDRGVWTFSNLILVGAWLVLALAAGVAVTGGWGLFVIDAVRQVAAQLTLASLAAGLLLLLLRRSQPAMLLGLAGAALAWGAIPSALAPSVAPGEISAKTSARARLTVLFHNAHSGKSDPGAIIALVEAEDPDVAAFVEMWPHERRRIDALRARYPFVIQQDDNRPIAIFSKRPMALATVAHPDWPTASYVSLDTAIGPIQLGVAHLSRPWPFSAPRYQSVEAERLRVNFFDAPPSILVGDFNAVPWGDVARALGRAGMMPVGGLEGTWPNLFPAIARVPIDNAFCNAAIRPVGKRVLAATGSDHLPVLFTFEAAAAHSAK